VLLCCIVYRYRPRCGLIPRLWSPTNFLYDYNTENKATVKQMALKRSQHIHTGYHLAVPHKLYLYLKRDITTLAASRNKLLLMTGRKRTTGYGYVTKHYELISHTIPAFAGYTEDNQKSSPSNQCQGSNQEFALTKVKCFAW
jgi:hypothetical protein